MQPDQKEAMQDTTTQDTHPRRPRGNPAMRRGAPSLNPKGRPRVAESLAAAIRARLSPDRIVDLAVGIIEREGTPAGVRLRTLEALARRGYGYSDTAVLG
jgi:hypothetical protein